MYVNFKHCFVCIFQIHPIYNFVRVISTITAIVYKIVNINEIIVTEI